MTDPTPSPPPPLPAVQTPSLKRRMACWFYEGILLFGVVVIAGLLFSAPMQMRHALHLRHALQAFLFVVFGLYFVYFWSKGQTLAMKTWHIRLADRAGRPVAKARALLRYLLSWVWFLPPLALMRLFKPGVGETLVLCAGWVWIWVLLARFQRERQFWHDIWAGTRLIDARREPPRDPQPAAAPAAQA
ncbi:MAG: RDD family protein [Burkholderiaceae bacterium]|nr:RDD family protein [Burkholderiaceae bacterium]